MASDTSLVFDLVARDRVSRALGPIAGKLNDFGTKIGTAVAGVGVAAGPVAAAGTAALGLAAGAVAAGLAVAAFKAAAAPQLEQVTEAWSLYEAAQDAAAEGGEAAAQANQAYADALAQMTPATRDTARAFIGLKKDHQAWSDGLSSSTMPVFTKGINVLRAVLPALTPLVKAGAGALGGFVDEIAAGVSSGGFKAWIADFAAAGGGALSDFLQVIKNLAVGFGGLLHAFLPVSDGMTGGLVDMTGAFADWATGLEHTEGFARFLGLAGSAGGALGNLGVAFVDLLVALAPFLGAGVLLAETLTQIVSAIPPGVISLLAQAFIYASVGMKAWALATTIWATITRVAAAVQWAWNAAMMANPLGLIIVGIVALIAIIVVIATKTTWFQTAWRAMTSGVAAAWSWVWGKIKSIAGFIVNLFMNWTIVGRIIKHWSAIKSKTAAIWGAVVGFVKRLPGRMLSFFLNWTLAGRVIKHFGQAKDGAVRVATRLVGYVSGLPGKIVRGIGSTGRLLYGKGQDVVRGLLNGVKSMGGWLAGELKSFAASVVPGPIADALGIGSPAKVIADEVGRWIPPGVIEGAEQTRPQLDRYMADLVQPSAPRAGALAAPMSGGRGGTALVRLELDVLGNDPELVRRIRRSVRVRGGNVQVVFGPGGG